MEVQSVQDGYLIEIQQLQQTVKMHKKQSYAYQEETMVFKK